jgi:hypothetical protein
MEFLLSSAYALLFISLIFRMKFFETEVNRLGLSLLFIIKLGFGVLLWYIYTYVYTDRATADIYKYFDDSKIMYDALWEKPEDYFRMLFAIGNDNAYFDQQYYTRMNYWYREFDNAIYNDSHTIIRFNAFARLFSFGFYHVHMVFMSFISFIGLVAIYKTFVHTLLDKWMGLAVIVFLVPSVLLWSSGVLKEGFLFFGLGMFIYHFHFICFSGHPRPTWRNYLWLVISLFVLAIAKFYVLVCLLPGLMAWVWIRIYGSKRAWFTFGTAALVVVLLGLNLHHLFPAYNTLQILSKRQTDFVALAKGGVYLLNETNDTIYVKPYDKDKVLYYDDSMYRLEHGTRYYTWGNNMLIDSASADSAQEQYYSLFKRYDPANSRIEITPLEPTVWSLLKNAPVAFFNSLVRPLLWESRSPMILATALENFIILFVMSFCLVFSNFRSSNTSVFYFCILFVIMLYTLTGLTTPVTGAIVRYRVPAIPFLLIAALTVLDTYKAKRKLPFLKRWLG